MMLLDGKKVAETLKDQVQKETQNWVSLKNKPPHLVVVLVGDDPASEVYVKAKHLACEKVGFRSTVIRLSGQTEQPELEEQVSKLNRDEDVDAILVQLPLPKHLSKERVLKLLSPEKDPDGLTYMNLGCLWAGIPVVKPCTPNGVMKILDFYKIPVLGKKAVVIGRSQIVGLPMAQLLTDANATVTICHSKTQNMREIIKAADIVVVAAGKPNFLGKEDFSANTVVIDVGIHRLSSGDKKLCGDVRFEEVKNYVAAITPVPGGVGPMTIACLLENTLILAKRRRG